MGDKVLLAVPGNANPFLKAAELAVEVPDRARIIQAGAFDSFGEPVQLKRGKSGEVVEVAIAAGRMVRENVLARELLGRYGAKR